MKTRLLVVILLIALIVIAAIISASPDEPLSIRSRGPGGARAFLRLLQEMGVDAREGDAPPSAAGTFFLFHDLRGAQQADELWHWIEGGGRVVVATPLSALAAGSGIGTVPLPGQFQAPRIMEPDCALPEAVGVRRINVMAGDLTLRTSSPRSTSCFTTDIGSLLAVSARGRGSLIVLGGPSLFVNSNLHREDNAVLALNIVRTSGPVIFGPPLPPGTQTRGGSFWTALPLAAKIVLIQICAAAVLFALVRARRLGKPVFEDAISPIPASELVRATAELYRGAHATNFAAKLVRSFARRTLTGRLGLPPRADAKTIEEALVKAAGLPEDRVSRVMTDAPVASDEELMKLGRDLQEIADEMRTTQR